ncbi:MAG: hypothetical protein M3M98_07085 [Nitrospirota bacterium]|nr:hypothetical protein [Nitrospirota bacterium]
MAQRTGMIAWLTLAISLVITGDLVMDLAFEGPDLSTSADASSIPEEPENAAEHILMPSQKTEAPSGIGWPAGISPAVQTAFLSTYLPSPVMQRAGPIPDRRTRSSPLPLLLPLRI